MNERLLQYIWQYNFYSPANLRTTCGREVEVIHPGNWNHNQGPDFLDARIRYEGTTWAGSIELHILSSEWNAHGHSADTNYKNVMLHVVWQHDADLNLPFPTLELQSRVSSVMLERYMDMMQSPKLIPCNEQLNGIKEITISSWKERLVAERLQERSQRVSLMLQQTNYHWEEVFWRLIARNFGSKVNGESFEKIATQLPLKILARHKQINQLEALLLGQAGILDKKFEDHYPEMLRKEYLYLCKKYSLPKTHFPLHYLRMRPANFPTVRLAQLAALLYQSQHFFSLVREAESLKDARNMLNVTANDYWDYHYMPDVETAFHRKNLGKQMGESIIVNTITVMLFTYGNFTVQSQYIDKAINWLLQLPAEHNSITNAFAGTTITNNNAMDSQAIIQLKSAYCDRRRCLECAIGNALLRNDHHL